MATEGIKDIFFGIAAISLNGMVLEGDKDLTHQLVNRAWDQFRASGGEGRYVDYYVPLATASFGGRYWSIPTPALVDQIDGLIELWVDHSTGGKNLSHISENTLGIYDHFKGGVYLAQSIGMNASNDNEVMVDYLSMIHATKHFREAWQWDEIVKWPDGKYRSRFVFRGRDLYTPPPPFKVPSPKLPYDG